MSPLIDSKKKATGCSALSFPSWLKSPSQNHQLVGEMICHCLGKPKQSEALFTSFGLLRSDKGAVILELL
jgi:hypothetical protein